MSYPSLSGVVTANLVETIGTGKYAASYVNWSRTMQLLRDNASGWLPFSVPASDGGVVHRAPVGGYLLIGFRNADGSETPPVPQAIMDNRNNAIPFDAITARDITDTHRRGICLAAALTFGLAYELWAKVDVENPYKRTDVSKEDIVEQLANLKSPQAVRDLYKTLPAPLKDALTEVFKSRVAQLEHANKE
jgi:hypothetical protein